MAYFWHLSQGLVCRVRGIRESAIVARRPDQSCTALHGLVEKLVVFVGGGAHVLISNHDAEV